MKNSVFIEQLELETFIGLHDWEKDKRQIVYTDINLTVDIEQVAINDDVNLSVDYERLANHLREWSFNNRTELLEKFGYQIIDQIKNNFSNIYNIDLHLTKKGVVPHTIGCGITISQEI